MATKIEAVIFDWAGTTVDFGSFAPVQAFIEAFQQFGIVPSVDEVRQPMGMLKWNHIESMMKMPRIFDLWCQTHGREFNNDDVDAVYAASEIAIMKILKDFAEPKPFVLETVTKLRQKNIKIGSTTGYTDEMMSIIVPNAKQNGYSPDFWCSPNAVNNIGRPYPYMIFKNMQTLNLMNVGSIVKVGDTTSDIAEAKNAGVIAVGVIEGSSIMGLSEQEFNQLTSAEKTAEAARVTQIYQQHGADFVINNMAELVALIEKIGTQA